MVNYNSDFEHMEKTESFDYLHVEWQPREEKKSRDQFLIASCKHHTVGMIGKLVTELIFFH